MSPITKYRPLDHLDPFKSFSIHYRPPPRSLQPHQGVDTLHFENLWIRLFHSKPWSCDTMLKFEWHCLHNNRELRIFRVLLRTKPVITALTGLMFSCYGSASYQPQVLGIWRIIYKVFIAPALLITDSATSCRPTSSSVSSMNRIGFLIYLSPLNISAFFGTKSYWGPGSSNRLLASLSLSAGRRTGVLLHYGQMTLVAVRRIVGIN